MPTLILRAALGLAALVALSLGAHAAQPFEARSFEQAQAAGKTILVDVWASWCPVCRRQQPIIESISKERPGLVVYRVDFDADKDTLRRLRVQTQSTLIVFKGSREVNRSTGVSDPDRIRAQVAKGF